MIGNHVNVGLTVSKQTADALMHKFINQLTNYMKKNLFKRGFTLIELLVVIAIIGILASVVLASLNSARSKGEDAAVKANLGNIRAQSELVYDNENGCYGDGDGGGCAAAAVAPGVCPTTADTIFANSNVSEAITAATNAGGLNACSSPANQTAWAVVVQLSSDPLKGWCADSSGKSKGVTIATNDQAGVTAEVNAAGQCVE